MNIHAHIYIYETIDWCFERSPLKGNRRGWLFPLPFLKNSTSFLTKIKFMYHKINRSEMNNIKTFDTVAFRFHPNQDIDYFYLFMYLLVNTTLTGTIPLSSTID